MSTFDDLEGLKARALCAGCVDEAFLKNEIDTKGTRHKCFYCKSIGNSYSLDAIACEVERAFADHYERTATEPDSYQYAALKDSESDYEWSREGQETAYGIMDAAKIPEEAAFDIQKILEDKHADFDSAAMGEESEFDSDAHYAEKATSDSEWQTEWRGFERSLQSQARFFNQAGARHLASIFKDVGTLQTRQGRRAVVDAGPGTSTVGLFRARVFHSLESIESALTKPDQSIGPPPSASARGGRMNAHGISVFYGANDPAVALAEVRPPVGSWAVVARFEIIRPLRLLDLTALVEITAQGSVFDPTFKHRLGRAKFLGTLSQQITTPVMPDDESREYLITQAIADFLASDTDIALDGMIFPSVQAAGQSENIVLFHKASRVQKVELPDGTKVTAHLGHGTEDGWEFDFSVYEETPEGEPGKKKAPPGFEFLNNLPNPPFWPSASTEERPDTLKIDLASVTVHEIKAVAFTTDDYPVRRHRTKAYRTSF